jgi:hypothetical protein
LSRRPAHLRDPASRASIIEGFLHDEYSAGDAARKLAMTPRNFRRLRLLYEARGVVGLVSGHIGRRSNRAIKPHIRDKVIALLHGNYNGLAAARISRRLEREEGITISASTVITWMVEQGLWQNRSRGSRKVPAGKASISKPGQNEDVIGTVRQMLGVPDTERDTLLMPHISGHEEIESRMMTLVRSLMIALQRPVTDDEIATHVMTFDPELHARLALIDHIRAHDDELLRRRYRQSRFP